MDANEVHIVIRRKSPNKSFYPLIVETIQSGKQNARFLIPPGFDDLSGLDGKILGSALYQSLADSFLWDLVKNTWINTSTNTVTLLLEIKAPELFRAPWEQISEAKEFSLFPKRLNIIRFLDKPSSVVARPLRFPISILVFSGIRSPHPDLLPDNDILRYYKATTCDGGEAAYLKALMHQAKFDIVHLRTRAELLNDNTSAILPGWDDTDIRPGNFLQILKRCGTRFLILQCTESNYGAILNFSHRLLNPEGPAILTLLETPSIPSWPNNAIFFDIAHDHPLDFIKGNLPNSLNPVLFITSGGGDILRISPQVSRIYEEINSKLKILNSIKDKHLHFIPGSDKKTEPHTRSSEYEHFGPTLPPDQSLIKPPRSQELILIDDAINTLQNEVVSPGLLDFRHEQGAMDPLSYAETLNSVVENQMKKLLPYFERVVNTWFKKDDKILLKNEKLTKDTEYNYEVSIGVASDLSNVMEAVAIPEKELSRFYSEKGLELRVELYSSDFRIPQDSRALILPKPPEESHIVSFQVFTPSKDCLARMRVCIYHKLNLIQSLLVQAIVGHPEISGKISGNQAEVDYSLSGSLTDIDLLPSRKLNIAVNDSGNGTHTLYIKGKGIKEQLDFGEGELKNTGTLTREKLQEICGDKSSGYRYDKKNNNGNERMFVTDLADIANFGYRLYTKIFLEKGWDFQDSLTQALAGSEIPIQIALTRSARHVYPWALVYDKPLVKGNHAVCRKFLSDLKTWKPEDSLSGQTCIKYGCPDHNKPEVICPSGFWGYRHIIEQPVSRDESLDGTGGMPLVIKTSGGNLNLIMGVSQELKEYQAHLQEITSLGKTNVDLLKTKQEIGIGLQRNDLQLVYFYCHGGRKGPETWLRIGGKDEKLVPSDLFAWGVRWHSSHPLVFINGCHTVDAYPDDFLEFNSMLARCKAAGIIGTEISIPEILARYFAVGFWKNLFKNKKVGVAIREQRLDMLKNYNLLGLAYTPYCYADLEISTNI